MPAAPSSRIIILGSCVAAVDARFETAHALYGELIVRMHGECGAEGFECGALLAQFFVDKAEPAQGAEMPWFALQRFLNGGNCAGVILGIVGDRGAAVP